MKPKMRTKEWLIAARRCAGLTQVELAVRAGLKSTIIVSLYETGAQVPSLRTWVALEEALLPFAPLMFVDEDALIADVRAIIRWERESALCRLVYVTTMHGFVFTDVRPAQGDSPKDPYITLPLIDALKLLEEQSLCLDFSDLFEEESPEDRDGAELKKMREALGLGQKEVADMLSTTQPAISYLERGLRKSSDFRDRYRNLLEQLTAEAKAKQNADPQGAVSEITPLEAKQNEPCELQE